MGPVRGRAVFGAAVLALSVASCGYAGGEVQVFGPPQPGFYLSASVDAISGPNGTATAAQAGLGQPPMEGRVTCITVEGDRATVGFRDEVNGPGYEYVGALIFVEDNGPGDGVDVVNVRFVTEVPTTCVAPTDQDLDLFPQHPGLESVYSGDITVGSVSLTTSDG
jgi:hypothetical protein